MKGGSLRLGVALLFGFAVCSQAQQAPADSKPQSVVDAARQKPTEKKAKRIYTNDDFRPHADDTATNSGQDVSGKDGSSQNSAKLDEISGTEKASNEAEDAVQKTEAKKVVEAKQIQIDTMMEEKARLEQRLHEQSRSADESAAISESIRSIEQSVDKWKKERDDAQKVVDSASKSKPQPGQ
jgi:hypothetical protein